MKHGTFCSILWSEAEKVWRQKTVPLVVYAQEGVSRNNLHDTENMVMNILIGTVRRCGKEVIYVQHDDGKSGEILTGKAVSEIDDRLVPCENGRCVVKKVNSCFIDSGSDGYFRSGGEKLVMITGIQTDYCTVPA